MIDAPAPIPELTLRTPRLRLRMLSGQDRSEFIRVQEVSREYFRRWMPANPPGVDDDEYFDQQLERARRAAREGAGVRMVALLDETGFGEDGRIAGFVNLNNIVRGVFQNADAGWRISADVAGRGLGTEAVWALLDLAFASTALGKAKGGLALHRVTASVIPHNDRSIRVAEKCGFRLEGLAREMLKIAGQWQDHNNYAKLAPEHQFRFLKD